MLYVDGWDGMVIIVHRSIKSTFGAYKCPDNKGCSYGELLHFCQFYIIWFCHNIKERFIHNSSLFNESSQKEYSGQSSVETSSFENLYLPSNNADCAKRSSLSERVFK